VARKKNYTPDEVNQILRASEGRASPVFRSRFEVGC
jgi:hypothetical protein